MINFKKIKEGDVFSFRYATLKHNEYDMRTHAFEGLLVAIKNDDGIRLMDTYWEIGRQGRILDEDLIREEVKKGGRFEFYVNLNDVEKINEYKTDYYAKEDLFYLHTQKACHHSCQFHYLRKGAKKNKEKILDVLNIKRNDLRHKIKSAVYDIERVSEMIAKVKNGDLEIYI